MPPAGENGAPRDAPPASLARRLLSLLYERYLVALAGSLLFGAGFLRALLDREGLFLHDRLAGTRIVNC